MVNKTLNQQLIESKENLERANEQERNLKNLYQEKEHKVRDKYRDLKWDLETKERNELKAIDSEEEEKINAVKLSVEPFLEIKTKILRKFELYSIKSNLKEKDSEVNRGYNYIRHTDAEIIETKDLKLLKIVSFISENNKPTNKFDLIIQIKFKNYRLEKYLKDLNLDYNNNLLEKSFKTQPECLDYFKKNISKYLEKVTLIHDKLLQEIEKVEINLDEEFDFNTIEYSAYGRNLNPKSKTRAIIKFIETKYHSPSEKEEIEHKIKITYKGGNKFEVNQEHELDSIKSMIRNSHFAIEPEIIVK